MAACQSSGPRPAGMELPALTAMPCRSSSVMPLRHTLKRARYGAFAALKNKHTLFVKRMAASLSVKLITLRNQLTRHKAKPFDDVSTNNINASRHGYVTLLSTRV